VRTASRAAGALIAGPRPTPSGREPAFRGVAGRGDPELPDRHERGDQTAWGLVHATTGRDTRRPPRPDTGYHGWCQAVPGPQRSDFRAAGLDGTNTQVPGETEVDPPPSPGVHELSSAGSQRPGAAGARTDVTGVDSEIVDHPFHGGLAQTSAGAPVGADAPTPDGPGGAPRTDARRLNGPVIIRYTGTRAASKSWRAVAAGVARTRPHGRGPAFEGPHLRVAVQVMAVVADVALSHTPG
jgi:hypothetical protein